MAYIEVTPAYGRDYKSQKEVQAAWDEDKDFSLTGFGQHGYLNKSDKEKYAPGDTIIVRYANSRKVYAVKS